MGQWRPLPQPPHLSLPFPFSCGVWLETSWGLRQKSKLGEYSFVSWAPAPDQRWAGRVAQLPLPSSHLFSPPRGCLPLAFLGAVSCQTSLGLSGACSCPAGSEVGTWKGHLVARDIREPGWGPAQTQLPMVAPAARALGLLFAGSGGPWSHVVWAQRRQTLSHPAPGAQVTAQSCGCSWPSCCWRPKHRTQLAVGPAGLPPCLHQVSGLRPRPGLTRFCGFEPSSVPHALLPPTPQPPLTACPRWNSSHLPSASLPPSLPTGHLMLFICSPSPLRAKPPSPGSVYETRHQAV